MKGSRSMMRFTPPTQNTRVGRYPAISDGMIRFMSNVASGSSGRSFASLNNTPDALTFQVTPLCAGRRLPWGGPSHPFYVSISS